MSSFLRWGTSQDSRPENQPVENEAELLLQQFRTSLAATFKGASRDAAPAHLVEELNALFEKTEWTWQDAYAAEQRLVFLMDERTLDTKLKRSLLDADRLLSPEVARWYRQRAEEQKDPEERRTTLLSLVEDLEWKHTLDSATRDYKQLITARTGKIFIASIVLFVVFQLLPLLDSAVSPLLAEVGDRAGGAPGAAAAALADKAPDSGRIWMLLIAMVSGLLGAAFSMLVGLKARLEASSLGQLKMARLWPVLVSRTGLGVGAALILYFFLESGVLSGEIFPAVSDKGDGLVDDISNQAQLVVWALISGFSEQLIPSMLARTEEQATGDSPDRPGRGGSRADAGDAGAPKA